MLVVTPQQMQEIDARAIKKYKIPGLTLMENAARALAEKARQMLSEQEGNMTACIVCGPGNNGGDGLAAARLLKEQGIEPLVFLLGSVQKLKGDAATSAKKLRAARIRIAEVKGGAGLAGLRAAIRRSGIIIDAIFGTGFHGVPDKLSGQVIEIINISGLPVLSADIPSGVEGRTGQTAGPAVRAAATVTMGVLKTGLLFHPGKALAGEAVIAEIGFPPKAIDEQKANIHTIEAQSARQLLPRRAPDAHKGSCGTALVVAGSAGMSGAAALTALSCLRSGAGLVYLGAPESLHDIMETKLTEVITKPLAETRSRSLASAAIDRIVSLLPQAEALAIGPGLSQHPDTAELVRLLLTQIYRPAVIDADGLNALTGKTELLHEVKAPLVLTPHYGEMARLAGRSLDDIRNDPLQAAAEFSQKYNQAVVLKGAPTIIAEPAGLLWINTTGNSGMATAGAGDVLTGLIAGFLAQGLKAAEAARLGVFLHGLAGDLAASDKTQYCLVAGDLIDHLPQAFKKLTEEER
jgi:NAD(P)H-hydrate epimerase